MDFILFILFGFIAQMIDGALGMAYGVSSSTLLLMLGISPAAASASIHASEVFTTGVSGIFHFKLGNVDKVLFKKLVLPGIVGGIIGAYILTAFPGEKIKPFIALYLLTMGITILVKGLKKWTMNIKKTRVGLLGLIGGFFDAVGGGGWGPIVTSTLLTKGHHPRSVIGSVNAAEFFVTFFQSLTFFFTIGFTHWKIIVGLLIGGMCAAPLAAYLCKYLPAEKLMIIVGILIVLLSMRTILLAI